MISIKSLLSPQTPESSWTPLVKHVSLCGCECINPVWSYLFWIGFAGFAGSPLGYYKQWLIPHHFPGEYSLRVWRERGGGGGEIALYYSIQGFCSAEQTLFDIAPSSMQAITEHPTFRSREARLLLWVLWMVCDWERKHSHCRFYCLFNIVVMYSI